MDTITTLQTLRATIGNPASKAVIRGFNQFCDTCNKKRIETALELYTGIRKDACFKCKIAEKAIGPLLTTGAKIFGITPHEMKTKFIDPAWRKALVNVLAGIGTFGINKPFISGSPFLVVWDVTYACNLKCKHCYANAGKSLKDELTTDQAKQAIDTLAKASVPIIAFSGGEPLIRPDILELTRYAHDQGIYVAVATNGTLITKKKAQEMKEAGIQFVQISLDGATAMTHDTFRGILGVYDKTIKGIQNASDLGFFVNIATTATQDNYQEIPEIINLCTKLNVDWFMLYNFVPTGRGEFIKNNDLTPQQREELLHMIYEKLYDDTTPVNVLSTAPQFARVALEHKKKNDTLIVPTHFYNTEISDRLTNLTEFIGGCGCGRFYCAIRPNGNIDPCVFFPLTVGNIINDDFETLWKKNPILQDLRNKDILKDACAQCTYRYQCGGCRARAYKYTGDYLSGDPGCINNIKLFNKI